MSAATHQDPVTVVRDLFEHAPLPAEGMRPHRIISAPDVRIIVLAFAEGHVLGDHAAPHPIVLQTLDGEVILRLPDSEVELKAGDLMRLDSGIRHEVEAVTDARLQVTFLLTSER